MVTIIATLISSATAVAVALIAAQAGQRKAFAALAECQARLAAMERTVDKLTSR